MGKLLKSLGVSSLEEAQKAIAEATAKREAEKSETQKRVELEASLKAQSEILQSQTQALKAFADEQMKSLSDAQRAAVIDLAGDEPAKQIKALTTLRPTWAAPAAPETVTNTAPPPGAPKPVGTNAAQSTDMDTYKSLKEINPILAARFAIANNIFASS
jgi:hypothetical protein